MGYHKEDDIVVVQVYSRKDGVVSLSVGEEWIDMVGKGEVLVAGVGVDFVEQKEGSVDDFQTVLLTISWFSYFLLFVAIVHQDR